MPGWSVPGAKDAPSSTRRISTAWRTFSPIWSRIAAMATSRSARHWPPSPRAPDAADMREASLEPPRLAFGLDQRLAAEALGTGLLLAIVIGSGIMGEHLAGGNAAIALLGNTIATGTGLIVLITIFGPLSGAHFNPAVSLLFALRGELSWRDTAAYIDVKVMGE